MAHNGAEPPLSHDMKLQKLVAFLAQQPHVFDWVVESRPLLSKTEMDAKELEIRFDGDEDGQRDWNPNDEGNTWASLEGEGDSEGEGIDGGGSCGTDKDLDFYCSHLTEEVDIPRLEISAYLFNSNGEPKQGIVHTGLQWPSCHDILATTELVIRYRISILLDKFM